MIIIHKFKKFLLLHVIVQLSASQNQQQTIQLHQTYKLYINFFLKIAFSSILRDQMIRNELAILFFSVSGSGSLTGKLHRKLC